MGGRWRNMRRTERSRPKETNTDVQGVRPVMWEHGGHICADVYKTCRWKLSLEIMTHGLKIWFWKPSDEIGGWNWWWKYLRKKPRKEKSQLGENLVYVKSLREKHQARTEPRRGKSAATEKKIYQEAEHHAPNRPGPASSKKATAMDFNYRGSRESELKQLGKSPINDSGTQSRVI